MHKDNIYKIVDIQFSYLQERLLNQKLSIELSQKTREWLAERGYDPLYGARPLKKVIQQHIHNNLASFRRSK